ncbi:MAG: hypothetical protein HND48_18950 [Chloroflexi bacterium]|nr:hypothetical protein [Chloroflexota bacterium]
MTPAAQDAFREMLLTVVGQAFSAAGYQLENLPLKWNDGQFRFSRRLANGLTATIEFQHLTYTDTEWSSGSPSPLPCDASAQRWAAPRPICTGGYGLRRGDPSIRQALVDVPRRAIAGARAGRSRIAGGSLRHAVALRGLVA